MRPVEAVDKVESSGQKMNQTIRYSFRYSSHLVGVD
jgi:hypothetical protein